MDQRAQQKSFKQKSGIRAKFLGIVIIFFTLFAANYFITRHMINTQKQDALLINFAGRQRMLSQRILRFANRMLLRKKGFIGVGDSLNTAGNIEKGIKLFHMTLHAFMEGAETLDSTGAKVFIERIAPEAVQEALRVVHKKWHPYIEFVDSIMNDDIFSEGDAENINMLFQRLEKLHILDSIDRVVTLLQKNAESKIKLLHRIQLFILGIGFIWSCLSILFLYVSILKPINRLISTMREVGRGDITKKRASIISSDEIGFFANSFNAMMNNLESTTVSMDYLNNIFKSILESLIVTDRDRVIQTVNHATLELLGYAREKELIGKKIDEIAVTPSTKKGVKRLFEPQSFEALLETGYIRDYDVHYRDKSGVNIPVSFSARMLKDKAGRFTGLVCVVRDMREYQALQAQIIQSSKLAALGTLSVGIAHELKNPLTAVMGKAEFINSVLSEGEKLDNALIIHDMADILDSSERMTVIIDHLRSFARESREHDWKLLRIDEVINDSFILLTKQLENKNIKVIKEMGPRPLSLLGDHTKMVSVFQNLITNAADAFNLVGDGREKFIKISVHSEEGKKLIVIFEDNGPGMEQEVLENIFNPFYTTKEAGRGTGLGLSILYRIIEEHRGKIEVSSVPNKGATFTITFPYPEKPEL